MPAERTPHLITSIGANPRYDEVSYTLGDATRRTRFASVALAHILNLRGGRVSVLVTEKARAQWYDALAAELAEAGLEPTLIDIPDGRSPQEILEVFKCLVGSRRGCDQPLIAETDALILDVTYALRHLPFVYQAALGYLVGLRGVEMRGIYYGAYELRDDAGTPIIDITGQFELLEWYQALATARQSGDLRQLSAPLRKTVKTLALARANNPALARVRTTIDELSNALAVGLPVEAGVAAADLGVAVSALSEGDERSTAAYLAVQSLIEPITQWSLSPGVQKGAVGLTEAELARQLQLADWFIEHGNIRNALTVLREWMVSYVMFTRQPNHPHWLDYGYRHEFEQSLNALSHRSRLASKGETAVALSPSEARISTPWDSISKLRNQIAHAGMIPTPVSVSNERLSSILADCQALMTKPLALPEKSSRPKRIVVTPLGLSPGVIFSVVKQLHPDHLIVVTSTEAAARLPEALEKAGSPDLPCFVVTLEDPHQGFAEANKLMRSDERAASIREVLIGHDEVYVNITGGTTALLHASDRIADHAERMGLNPKRVALVDRRPYDEQRNNPYVAGEVVHLDDSFTGPDAAE